MKLKYMLLAFLCLLVKVQGAQKEEDLLIATVALPEAEPEFVIDDGIVESLETESPNTQPAPHIKDPNDLQFNSTVEPLMLYSTGLSIKGYWMRSKQAFNVITMHSRPAKIETPSITQALSIFFDMLSIQPASTKKSEELAIKATNTIVGVDMDPGNKEVYWVELGKEPGLFSSIIEDEQFESRHRRQNAPYSIVVDSGLHSPEDVALDTIGRNLYITDAGLPAIVACSIKHSHCKIIYNQQLHKPRAIIVDPSTGWLTYTDWGDRPGLYLLSMDGRKREVLVDTDVVWPNGLAADYESNQLYWADARLSRIESIDLKTKKRREVIRESAANPFSLSIFEQRIFWSDWSGNVIKTCNKQTGEDIRNITNAENIYGIHIYHPSLHKSPAEYDNPCWSKRCSHLCLIGPSSVSFAERKSGSIAGYCSCPQSMELSKMDLSTCYEKHLSFLMILVNSYIAQIFPERIGQHVIEKIISSKNHIIRDVASDWLHYRIYFFDSATSAIHIVNLSEKIPKIKLFLKTEPGLASLTYDPWTDNLYWLNPIQGTISMSPVKGRFEIVLRGGFKQATSMVLDKKNRFFYVGTQGRIVRVDFSGSSHSDLTIVNNEIDVPIGLQLDESSQRLYWADPELGTIESIGLSSLKGDDDRIYHRRRVNKIMALAVYHDSLLWTLKESDQINMVKLSNPFEERTVVIKLPSGIGGTPSEPRRLIMIDPGQELVNSACHGRGCSHGCTLDSTHNALCICPPSLVLTNRTFCDSPVIPTVSTSSPRNTASTTALPSSTTLSTTTAMHEQMEDSSDPTAVKLQSDERGGNSMIWLIVLLLLLSVTGLITLAGLILYKQGMLPKQVSQLTVSFIPQRDDKDGAMLLVDEET